MRGDQLSYIQVRNMRDGDFAIWQSGFDDVAFGDPFDSSPSRSNATPQVDATQVALADVPTDARFFEVVL